MDVAVIGPPERQRWWQSAPREDASAVLGLQSGYAAVALVVTWVGFVLLGLADPGVEHVGLYLATFVAIGIAYALLLLAPGTPVARWAALGAVVAQVAAAAGIVWAIVPVDRGALTPFVGGLSVIGALFCLRGRALYGWSAFGLVTVVLSVAGGQRADPLAYVVQPQSSAAGILVMMSVFAAIIGPRAEQLFALRRQAGRERAALAVREIRDHELARLDDRVRPLLRRIADSEDLDETELASCRLVAAQLRDRIRAPGLDVGSVADAAWEARDRGVQVLLLDDRGDRASLADLDIAVGALSTVRAAAVGVLAEAAAGDDVTVRLLPEGRGVFATITVASPDGVALREFTPE